MRLLLILFIITFMTACSKVDTDLDGGYSLEGNVVSDLLAESNDILKSEGMIIELEEYSDHSITFSTESSLVSRQEKIVMATISEVSRGTVFLKDIDLLDITLQHGSGTSTFVIDKKEILDLSTNVNKQYDESFNQE